MEKGKVGEGKGHIIILYKGKFAGGGRKGYGCKRKEKRVFAGGN